MLQIPEIQQQSRTVQRLAAQRNPYLIVMPVRILALPLVIPQIVPRRKPALHCHFIHVFRWLPKRKCALPSFYLSREPGPRRPRRCSRLSSFRRSTCSNIAVITPSSATTSPPTVINSALVFHSVPFAGSAGCNRPDVSDIPKHTTANNNSTPARMYKFRATRQSTVHASRPICLSLPATGSQLLLYPVR